MDIARLARSSKNVSLILAASLPFLVPFEPARNIDLQGILLIVSGGFAWLALFMGYRKVLGSLGRIASSLLVIFALSCIVSSLASPHLGYNILGAPYVRLGSAGLLACIGIGLLAKTLELKQLLTRLYLLITGLALLSVPYSWWRMHTLWRIGGVFAQADVMACFVGCGLIIGLGLMDLYPERRRLLFGSQGFLAVLLLLTQTRAVLFLVAGLWLLWMMRQQQAGLLKATIYLILVLGMLAGLHHFVPDRLTNRTYASQSVHYRLALQKDALQASTHRPFWGYGPGNLADALACSRLPAAQLQATCRQGYFFNSSHNIFIDRVLAIGWLGGLSYLLLVVLAIYRSWHAPKELRIVTYALILITGYYLTNVTSATLELLFWVLILQGLFSRVSA